VRLRPPQLPLQLWLLLSYALVLLLPLGALLGTGALAHDLVDQTKEDLEHQGALIAMVAAERMGKPEQMSEMLAAAKEQTLAGIRITDDGGVVVASSGDGVGRRWKGARGSPSSRAPSRGRGWPRGQVRAGARTCACLWRFPFAGEKRWWDR
jgi:hypothetical protein